MEEFIKAVMTQHDIPGVSLAVVYKGKPIHSNGYGVLNASVRTALSQGQQSPDNNVNEHTQFCIGSLTKAFTSAIWASILEENKGINWDTPLKDMVKGSPVFSDDFRTSRTCLRDMLAHKMGIELGEGDFDWMCDAFTSTYHIVKNTRHLPLACGFRTKMMYNNYMYGIVGYLADLMKGESWEDMVQNIFDTLGMKDAGFIHKMNSKVKNFAHPHMAIKGVSTPIDISVHKAIGKIAAAGSIFASANDMAKWMLFHLNKGNVDGVQFIRKTLLEECYKPQFALPNTKHEWNGYVHRPDFPATETRDAYGFGWWLGTYREYRTVAHAGELFGFDSLLTLYPDVELGIYTCFNGPSGEASHVGNQLIHYYIADQVLKLEQWLTPDRAITFPLPWKNNKQEYFHPVMNSPIETGKQSHRPLLCYHGTYSHPFLGEIEITIPKAHTGLNMHYGRNGTFFLHPNGVEDEFRMEALGSIRFIYQVDIYSPSEWMTVHFEFTDPTQERSDMLFCSWFESAPQFNRIG